MAKMSIIINRQNGLGFHGVPGKEAVVEAVLFCADNLQAQDKILLSNISVSSDTFKKSNYSQQLQLV